jgi:hypothetical protein
MLKLLNFLLHILLLQVVELHVIHVQVVHMQQKKIPSAKIAPEGIILRVDRVSVLHAYLINILLMKDRKNVQPVETTRIQIFVAKIQMIQHMQMIVLRSRNVNSIIVDFFTTKLSFSIFLRSKQIMV